ncbi:hypothetical protein QQP08_014176 [Theobroma cacao]|uniref:Uncharacterized protein n=1 Tax=Theobroma cacao TaxID=3641 RepID=A0A061EGE6_THECC|nr:Uncharacterized protein TCM_019176 [Theobroma cacao]WRX21689.1 hypothetical protein QQP08_014176 [Theobroma cacao]
MKRNVQKKKGNGNKNVKDSRFLITITMSLVTQVVNEDDLVAAVIDHVALKSYAHQGLLQAFGFDPILQKQLQDPR